MPRVRRLAACVDCVADATIAVATGEVRESMRRAGRKDTT